MMAKATKKNLYLDRPSMHVDDYDVPVVDQISNWMKDMKLIREFVRRLLIENAKSVEADTMKDKLSDHASIWSPPAGWSVTNLNVISPQGTGIFVQYLIEGTRESFSAFSAENEKVRLKNHFEDFAKKRGWNLLRVREEPMPSRNPVMKFELLFDQQPNIQNTNYFADTEELQTKEMILLHLTKKKYIPSIKKGGFKPTRSSSDGINFGNGRSYFVAVSSMDWDFEKDTIIGWFNRATESMGFAGIDPAEKQALLVVQTESLRKNIKFYIDTEFGDTTGTVGTYGFNIGKAIWTPSHISASAISEVIEL